MDISVDPLNCGDIDFSCREEGLLACYCGKCVNILDWQHIVAVKIPKVNISTISSQSKYLQNILVR